MTEVNYGISIADEHGNHLHDENSRALFETMSGIKTVIGTLAIEKAATDGRDIADFSLTVSQHHHSNGSGTLKHALANQTGGFAMNLESLLEVNVAESDTVATNVLIDYLDGKEQINRSIQERLGLRGMFLVTDRIYFPGVDHDIRPFQVGAATMRDFTDYYQRLWADEGGYGFTSKVHDWHKVIHGKGANARLFGMPTWFLPQDIQWLHKNGSGEDVVPGRLYSTVMDAGQLTIGDKTLYVGAASTTRHKGPNMPPRAMVTADYVTRNDKAISSVL